MIDKEKIHKLMSSGNWEDQILGMHFLSKYSYDEIREIFSVGDKRTAIDLPYKLNFPETAVYYTADNELLFYSPYSRSETLIKWKSRNNYVKSCKIINI